MAVSFYRYSFRQAQGDLAEDDYRESEAENIRCIEYIQSSENGLYANAYKENVVDSDGAYMDKCIEEFGLERMMFLAANTVKSMPDDGRWSKEVVDWAKHFNAGCRDWEHDRYLTLSQIHVGVVNILAKRLMQEYDALNLFTAEHCDKETKDYEGRVIVLSNKAMKERYWKPEYQLWLATGGFGCSPTASGQAVYAVCLYDGDKNRWNRHQVVGVIKDELLPDWAREKLDEMQNPGQNTGMELN